MQLPTALQGKRLKIYTRSFSLELYTQSKGLYEGMGLPCVRLTDQSADGYFYTMLKDTDCDVAINVDEDAFVVNPEAVLALAAYVVENGYANAGCPDGGSGCPRGGNPIITNPFFNVFNLELIRTKFAGKKSVTAFDFKAVLPEMEKAFPTEILFGNWNFANTGYEPYYPFFFWLAYNFKTLYLHGQKHADGISTILYTPENEVICLHSWMARFYNTPSFITRLFQKNMGKQKQRIDNLIAEAYAQRNMPRLHFGQSDYAHFRIDTMMRWCIKVPQRIAGWPRKWKRWITKE